MTERLFKIMGGPAVPWRLVAPHEEQARINHDQSLQRLHDRGGLDPAELWCAVHGKRLREMPSSEVANAWLKRWVAEDVEQQTAERVASWLEKRTGTHFGIDWGRQLAADIRAGAWRKS